MRYFVLRISIFAVAFILFIGSMYIISDLYLNLRKQYFLKLKSNINIVFAGDSNIECAVNDSLIPNSVNIAQGGEAYLYTYVKLKSLLKYNKQIKTVFLGFSFHTLNQSREKTWLFEEDFVLEKNKYYNYLLGNRERSLIFRTSPKIYVQGIRDYTFTNFISVAKSYYSKNIINFGGYKFLDRNKLQENIKLNKSKPDSVFHFEEGKYQIEYLKRISDLCKENKIKLILLNAPKHITLTKSFNYNKSDYGFAVSSILENDSLLDLSSLYFPDSCYADVTHLNYKGARIFSELLSEKIYTK